MELQQLKYFRVVAEQEHVTRAAEKLFVSQSAVSRAVTQLEQ
jgi:DNA-binding transcriptional LysR family regulator